MLKVHKTVLEDTINEWYKMREVLRTEKENQYAIIRRLGDVWEGEAHQTYEDVHRALFMAGIYLETEEIVEKIYQALVDADAQIGVAMQRCHKIPEQLECDDYFPPYLGGWGLYNSGILALHHSPASDCDRAIENALEQAAENRKLLYNAITTCADIIDLSYEEDALNASYRKIKRLEHFKIEFDKYVQEVDEIQDNLETRVRAILAEYGEVRNREWFHRTKAYCEGNTYIYTSQQIDELNLPPELAACVEQNYLRAALENRGLTPEQYRASVLDVFMYLDIFDSDLENGYRAEEVIEDLLDGMTVNEIITLLGENDIYADGSESKGSNRHIYYAILKDAVAIDPTLGELQITHMSRMMGVEDVGRELNTGTNGIVFRDMGTNTIYVAYRGTSRGEWGDDGERLNCKTMEDLTPQMEQTLAYFNYVARDMGWTEDMNIYVTGHSQGGNDAQISMLLSPYGKYVDGCYSFDGEGHSPELLEDIERVYGTEEYKNRLARMYSICGEYDFVNHLGEKVIPEENTIYIECNFKATDFFKAHDIASMFCDEEMKYNGMINTGIGTEASWVTDYTAELWEEMYEMPDEMRESCQAALMNAAEAFLSKFDCVEGLNGEKASGTDYSRFLRYGLDVIVGTGVEIKQDAKIIEFLENYIFKGLDIAVEKGSLSEAIAAEAKKETKDTIERYMGVFESWSDSAEEKVYDEFLVRSGLRQTVGNDRICPDFLMTKPNIQPIQQGER